MCAEDGSSTTSLLWDAVTSVLGFFFYVSYSQETLW